MDFKFLNSLKEFLNNLGYLLIELHSRWYTTHKLVSKSGETGKKALSCNDVEVVMKRLGLWSSNAEHRKGRCEVCQGLDGAMVLLEEKKASLDELEEAFAVFDENGDGMISANELVRVMRELRLEEGMEIENCKRMIDIFDSDGDGRINFSEFQDMLEHAI